MPWPPPRPSRARWRRFACLIDDDIKWDAADVVVVMIMRGVRFGDGDGEFQLRILRGVVPYLLGGVEHRRGR